MTSEPLVSSALWERIPAAAQASIRALEARVAAQAAMVQQRREPLQQTSRTSSRPPVSDPPQALATRPRREPSGRRPGGQPGPERHARGVVPGNQVDVGVPVTPERCRCCQQPLQGEAPQPQWHRVAELPPVKPVVTEYPWPQRDCSACGAATRAEGPSGGPTGGFGPRLQASMALCTGASHLSKRTTQRGLEDPCGIQLGLGTSANLEPAAVQALAEPTATGRLPG
jgi:transposase